MHAGDEHISIGQRQHARRAWVLHPRVNTVRFLRCGSLNIVGRAISPQLLIVEFFFAGDRPPRCGWMGLFLTRADGVGIDKSVSGLFADIESVSIVRESDVFDISL